MLNIFKKKDFKYNLSVSFDENMKVMEDLFENDKSTISKISLLWAKEISDANLHDAISLMKLSNELEPSFSKMKWIGFHLYDEGKFQEAVDLLSLLPYSCFRSESETKKLEDIKLKVKTSSQYVEELLLSLEKKEIERKKFSSQAFNAKQELEKVIKERKQFSAEAFKYKQELKSMNKIPVELNDKTEKEYIDNYSEEKWRKEKLRKIDAIPLSNGTRFYKKHNLRIGIVADPFFYESIESAADFIYITPKNFDQELEKIDLFLCVSTWNGLNGEWSGVANNVIGEKGKLLVSIIDKCNELDIPTAFYSKEDPSNFDIFLKYATRCNHIFTSASDCIEKYKENCPQAKTFDVLLFSVNPLENNPIGMNLFKKNNDVLFSGSWMAKYEERCEEFFKMAKGVELANYRIHIVDRFYGLYNGKYDFPKELQPYVTPSIEHKSLQKFHKLTNWSLNINTVKYSPTMFANRAYELQANGCMLLSNYSIGVNNILPTIFFVTQESTVPYILNSFDKEELYERQITGIRTVYSRHVCFDRLEQILSKCGIEYENNNVSVLVIGKKTPNNVKNFERQSYLNKTFKSKFTKEDYEKYDVITYFEESALYEEYYLEDMMNAFKYTDSDFITKDAYYENSSEMIDGVEHDYINVIKDKYRTLFWMKSFDIEDFISQVFDKNEHRGYSIDHLNYYKKFQAPIVLTSKKYKLSVVIPVFNNGLYLYGKSFASVKRLSMFNDIEIIIVDDGSTDVDTISRINYLQRHYSNVKTLFLPKGGSGSASLPRNKGLELVTSPYVLYFDPDDDMLDDGYTTLFKELEKENFDIVIGNNYRYSDKVIKFDNYKTVQSILKTDEYYSEKGLSISDLKYKTIRIQNMIIRTSLIRNNNLQFVEGAIGEDTLFSWQILKLARSIKFTDIYTHIYYASREDSETNIIKPSMFKKLNLVQPSKIQWLVKNNLIYDYMNNRFEAYIKSWVLDLLNKSHPNLYNSNRELVINILHHYKDFYSGNDEAIKELMVQKTDSDD